MAKRNDSMMLTSPGQTDLGALRFHGLEAVKAGGRAIGAGYRRARPHVVAAAEATGRAVEAVARRGAAAVRTWRAKPNDARFADAPSGHRFAAIRPGTEGGFSVVGYHPTHGGAAAAIRRSGAVGHIVVLPGAKANKSALGRFAEWVGLAEADEDPQAAGAPPTENVEALLLTLRSPGPATAAQLREAVADLTASHRLGRYRRADAVHAFEPAVHAALRDLRRREQGERRWFAPGDLELTAKELAREFERSGHGHGRGAKANGARKTPPALPAQPSLFDAPRRSVSGDDRAMGAGLRHEAARERSVPFPSADVMALHDIFWGKALVDTRGEPPYYRSIATKAVAAGLALSDGAGGFSLTDDGRAVVAREHARLDAQMRREEGAIGAAMRREGAGHRSPPAKPAPRVAAGTPTDLNLWVLSELFQNTASIANKVEATDLTHLRRCLKAGLITAAGGRLTLTEAGIAALTRYRASRPAKANGRRSAKPNHHGGRHAPGDPLGVYLPPLAAWDHTQSGAGRRDHWRWHHDALGLTFRVYALPGFGFAAVVEIPTGKALRRVSVTDNAQSAEGAHRAVVRWYAQRAMGDALLRNQ